VLEVGRRQRAPLLATVERLEHQSLESDKSNDIVDIVLDSPASGYRVGGTLPHDRDNLEGRVSTA
jgi:hypothetical protein